MFYKLYVAVQSYTSKSTFYTFVLFIFLFKTHMNQKTSNQAKVVMIVQIHFISKLFKKATTQIIQRENK